MMWRRNSKWDSCSKADMSRKKRQDKVRYVGSNKIVYINGKWISLIFVLAHAFRQK